VGAVGVQPQQPAGGPLASQARLRDFEHVVQCVGDLRAAEATQITSPLSGPVITYMAPEGAAVKAGDVIVRLDPTSLESQVEDVVGEINTAEAELAAAEAASERTKWGIGANIENLEADLTVAEARLAMVEGRPFAEDLASAQAALDEASARCAYAERWREISRILFDDGVLSQRELREAELAHYTAALEQQKTRGLLDLVQEGAGQEDLDAARAELAGVRASLEEARGSSEGRARQAEVAVASAREDLERLRAKLAGLREDLAGTRIEAPHDGTVFAPGGRRAALGEGARRGRALVQLADTSTLLFSARARECDSQLIEAGQSARVCLLSLPRQPLEGTVVSVGSALVEEEGVPGMRFLEVDIELASAPAGVQPGMGGRAEVTVAGVPSALVIPQACVRGGTVTVLDGDRARVTAIELLATDGTFAVVKSGLTTGQWVRLLPEG